MWEYKTAIFDSSSTRAADGTEVPGEVALDHVLNHYGKLGWELVQMVPTASARQPNGMDMAVVFALVFKKRLPENTKGYEPRTRIFGAGTSGQMSSV